MGVQPYFEDKRFWTKFFSDLNASHCSVLFRPI
jgi:hypothetical protein